MRVYAMALLGLALLGACSANESGNKGAYACSPEDSSFTAVFTNMEVTECKWQAHDGQQPDE